MDFESWGFVAFLDVFADRRFSLCHGLSGLHDDRIVGPVRDDAVDVLSGGREVSPVRVPLHEFRRLGSSVERRRECGTARGDKNGDEEYESPP